MSTWGRSVSWRITFVVAFDGVAEAFVAREGARFGVRFFEADPDEDFEAM